MMPIVSWVNSVWPVAEGGTWAAIERGGSDRQFWRGAGAAMGLVVIHYGTEKVENARYADCAKFLQARGVNVPQVLAHDEQERFLLFEDAGEQDLWMFRESPWGVRRNLYRKALTQLAALHACDLSEAETAGVLQVPFDEKLYMWEQDYFRQHFLRRRESKESSALLTAQAIELAAGPRVLVHRDFQSQNVMVQEGVVRLLDFQGMRAGRGAYDVASLLYDPYVNLTSAERKELGNFYAGLTGHHENSTWQKEFRTCARQRLMQALGAYGFLGHVKGRRNFLSYIPIAAERFAVLCEEEPAWRPLASEVRQAASTHSL